MHRTKIAEIFYVRFMDDILILAPTRWQLRGAVKTVNRILGTLIWRSIRTRRSSERSSAASTFLAIASVRQG